MKKWEKEMAELAAEFGRAIVKTNGGHYKLVRPGSQPVFVSSTPSDFRTLKNTRRDLRRHDNREGGER
jgi:hypothetical protein